MVLKKVYQYLDTVKMKKVVVGGFEEEGVYQVIEKVCSLYEQELAQRQTALENGADSVAALQAQCTELREKLEMAQSQLQQNAAALESYRTDNSRLTQMVSTWTSVKEELQENARREMVQLQAKAEQEAAQLRLQAEQDAAQIRLQARQTVQHMTDETQQELTRLKAEVTALEQAKSNVLRSMGEIQRFCSQTQEAIRSLEQ